MPLDRQWVLALVHHDGGDLVRLVGEPGEDALAVPVGRDRRRAPAQHDRGRDDTDRRQHRKDDKLPAVHHALSVRFIVVALFRQRTSRSSQAETERDDSDGHRDERRHSSR